MERNKLTISDMLETDEMKKLIRKLEIISVALLGIIILMIVFGFTTNESFGLILTLTFTILSLNCFFIGFKSFNSESKILSLLFYKIYGFGLALGFMSLLFIRQKWSYSNDPLLYISFTMITFSLVLGVREKMDGNKNNIGLKYFLRIFIALLFLIYTLY